MNKPRLSISAVVPAYNEAKTLGQVVRDLLAIPFLAEIIVVDDGSTDETAQILKGYEKRITVVTNQENCGKGYAVAMGIETAKGEVILILDADVLHYNQRDLQLLLDPVLKGECDFTLKPTRDSVFGSLSGIRCYWRKDLAPLLGDMKESSRYGLEILLNQKLQDKKGVYVPLPGCQHVQKFDKFPLPLALWEYAKEGISLLRQAILKG